MACTLTDCNAMLPFLSFLLSTHISYAYTPLTVTNWSLVRLVVRRSSEVLTLRFVGFPWLQEGLLNAPVRPGAADSAPRFARLTSKVGMSAGHQVASHSRLANGTYRLGTSLGSPAASQCSAITGGGA